MSTQFFRGWLRLRLTANVEHYVFQDHCFVYLAYGISVGRG